MRRFLFDLIVGLGSLVGSLASFLIWAGIKPKDLWGWSMPHWAWLVASLALFSVAMVLSVYALIQSRRVLRKDSEIPRLQRELSGLQARYDKEKTQDLNELAQAKNKALELERAAELLPLKQSQVLAGLPVFPDDIRLELLCVHRGTTLDFTQTTLFFKLSLVSDTDTGIKGFAIQCSVNGRVFSGTPMDDLGEWIVRTPFKHEKWPNKSFADEVLDTHSLWKDVRQTGLRSGLMKTGWIGLHIPEPVAIQNKPTKVRFEVLKPQTTRPYRFWFSDTLVECERENIFDIAFLNTH